MTFQCSETLQVTTSLPRIVYSTEYSAFFQRKKRLMSVSSARTPSAAWPWLSTSEKLPSPGDGHSVVMSPPKGGWEVERASETNHPKRNPAPPQHRESSPFVRQYIQDHGDLYAFTEDDNESTKRKKATALRRALQKHEKKWNDDRARRKFARTYGYDSDDGPSLGLVGVEEDEIREASKKLRGDPTFHDPLSQLDERLESVPIFKLSNWLEMLDETIQQSTSEADVGENINPYVRGFLVDTDVEEEA